PLVQPLRGRSASAVVLSRGAPCDSGLWVCNALACKHCAGTTGPATTRPSRSPQQVFDRTTPDTNGTSVLTTPAQLDVARLLMSVLWADARGRGRRVLSTSLFVRSFRGLGSRSSF